MYSINLKIAIFMKSFYNVRSIIPLVFRKYNSSENCANLVPRHFNHSVQVYFANYYFITYMRHFFCYDSLKFII